MYFHKKDNLYFLSCSVFSFYESNIFFNNKRKKTINYSISFDFFFAYNVFVIFKYILLTVKNLIYFFFARYFRDLLEEKFFFKVGKFRNDIARWSLNENEKYSFKFRLPMAIGSRRVFKEISRHFFLKFLLNKRRKILNKFRFYNKLLYFSRDRLFYNLIKKYSHYRLKLFHKVYKLKIRSVRNNLFFTFIGFQGQVLYTMSCGKAGFKGKKKRTVLAAKEAANKIYKKIMLILGIDIKVDPEGFIIKQRESKKERKKSSRLRGYLFTIEIYGFVRNKLFKAVLREMLSYPFPCTLLLDKRPVAHSLGVRKRKPRRV
jgi:ribosomal protein S11